MLFESNTALGLMIATPRTHVQRIQFGRDKVSSIGEFSVTHVARARSTTLCTQHNVIWHLRNPARER